MRIRGVAHGVVTAVGRA
jgi:hypothetical protein